MDPHSDRALAGAADGPDQSVDLDEGTAARRRRRRRGRVIAGLVLRR